MVRVALALCALLVGSTPSFAQEQAEKRPALLIPLYAAHFALQGADVHSTMQALKQGYAEANPLFRDGDPAKMIGVKLAAGTAAIVLTEKLWKRHRAIAVGAMIAGNGALAVIAARNYQIASRAR
jgi:hypothetical protein